MAAYVGGCAAEAAAMILGGATSFSPTADAPPIVDAPGAPPTSVGAALSSAATCATLLERGGGATIRAPSPAASAGPTSKRSGSAGTCAHGATRPIELSLRPTASKRPCGCAATATTGADVGVVRAALSSVQ